jgi:hypothetical protein
MSTLHDPEGRMVKFLHQCLPHLVDLYQFLVIVATPTTSQRTTDILVMHQAQVCLEGSEHVGESRRKALKLGLKHRHARHFHYCDFDRLLHWTLHYPDELRSVILNVIPRSDFLVIGRTPEAFDSHPPAQKETEEVVNRVFSFILGTPMDVVAGSCGMSRPAAEQITQKSIEQSNATDTEWPLIVRHLVKPKLSVEYIAVHGLEFETPTFFGAETFRRANTPGNWRLRVQLCRKSVEAAIRVSTQA